MICRYFGLKSVLGSLILAALSSGIAVPLAQARSAMPEILIAQELPPPDAAITPIDGQVNIRFINETSAPIDYEVIGNTEPRTVGGRTQILLRDLAVPTTMTFRRQDKGFLQATLQQDQSSDTLILSVRETTDFTADRVSLYIDQQGAVYFN